MNDQLNPNAHSDTPAESYSAADLPINEDGAIYHLQAKPGQISPDILVVGDPGRAELIGSMFLRDLEFEHEHRGLVTVTGTSQVTGNRATIISPVRTTVTTSGMGTPSLEIVLGELVVLNEIDFATGKRRSNFPRLRIIRVGTSGALQASTALGTLVITSYAIGLDNTGMYYEAPYPDDNCRRLEEQLSVVVRNAMSPESRFYGKIHPYVSRAEPAISAALLDAAEELGAPARLGITASSSGFFAPQGRDVARVNPSVSRLTSVLGAYDPNVDGQRIENMEMEASFLIHYLCGLGHWAGAICPIIDNRPQHTFDHHYKESAVMATKVALLAFAKLRNRYPDDRIG